MERILIDTSIVLDLLGGREPYVTDAQLLFTMADRSEIGLYMTPVAQAHIHDMLSDQLKPEEIRKVLVRLGNLIHILPVDQRIVDLALTSEFKDFTDAVQYFAASEHDMDLILTRNLKGFRNSHLLVLNPKQYIELQRTGSKSA